MLVLTQLLCYVYTKKRTRMTGSITSKVSRIWPPSLPPRDTWLLPSAQGSAGAQHMGLARHAEQRPAEPSRSRTAAGSPGARGHTGLAARLSRRGSGVRERVPEPHRLLRNPGRSGDTAPRPLWLRGPYRCLLTRRSQRHYRRPPTGRKTLSAESLLPSRAGWTGELRTRSCVWGLATPPHTGPYERAPVCLRLPHLQPKT